MRGSSNTFVEFELAFEISTMNFRIIDKGELKLEFLSAPFILHE